MATTRGEHSCCWDFVRLLASSLLPCHMPHKGAQLMPMHSTMPSPAPSNPPAYTLGCMLLHNCRLSSEAQCPFWVVGVWCGAVCGTCVCGFSRRLLCITPTEVLTQDPGQAMRITNVYRSVPQQLLRRQLFSTVALLDASWQNTACLNIPVPCIARCTTRNECTGSAASFATHE